MPYRILLATTFAALAATSARADQWCGSASQKDAVVQCGYMSSSECETAVGKGGVCFVDPDVALRTKRAAPEASNKVLSRD
jgi:hypothetical protein